METIQVECGACSGTGLYSGFAEPKGIAVVCVNCNGSGCKKMSYTLFTHRKHKMGIRTVRKTGVTFIDGDVKPGGESISYSEFQKGKMP